MTPAEVLAAWSGWGSTKEGDAVAADILAALAAHGYRVVGEGEAAPDATEALQAIWTTLFTVQMETEKGRWGGPQYDITYDHLYEMATSALAALDVVTAAIKDPS